MKLYTAAGHWRLSFKILLSRQYFPAVFHFSQCFSNTKLYISVLLKWNFKAFGPECMHNVLSKEQRLIILNRENKNP
jgi:hypothetical protein